MPIITALTWGQTLVPGNQCLLSHKAQHKRQQRPWQRLNAASSGAKFSVGAGDAAALEAEYWQHDAGMFATQREFWTALAGSAGLALVPQPPVRVFCRAVRYSDCCGVNADQWVENIVYHTST